MLPTQKEIEIPLLQTLMELGGQAKAAEVYPALRNKFPNLREEDLAETLPSGPIKWTNRVQWVRQRLISAKEIDSPERGIWRITEKGKKRIGNKTSAPEKDFLELYEEYEASFRKQLIERLQDLSAEEFEQFSRKLLRVYGFADVRNTRVSKDGGIDGFGKLRIGLATMNVAFQCKRWQGAVGRPDVDKFRGAIQGEFEQGIFFTTSDFSPEARDASLRRGAVPIILLNGESIIDLMIDKGLGVERHPLHAYQLRPSDLTAGDES